MAKLLNNIISTNDNEIVLKHNRGVELTGVTGLDVSSWSSIETGWVFSQNTEAKRPTYNDTEKAIEFTESNNEHLIGNKSWNYSEAWTIRFWIKTKQDDILHRYLSNFDNDNDNGFQITYSNLGPYYAHTFNMYSDNSNGTQHLSTSYDNSGNDWNYILIVYTGSVVSAYVNGKPQSCRSITINKTTMSEASIWFGKLKYYSGDPFDGYIDDFNISKGYNDDFNNYDGALKYITGTQVFTPPPRTGTLVPVLDLKSELYKNQNVLYDSGNYVYQWKDADDNMALQTEIGYNPIYNLTNALTFDGVNDFMTVEHNTKYNLGTNDFTIIVKFYINSSAKLDYISLLSKKLNNNNLGWYLYFRNQNDNNRYKLGFGYSGATYTDILSSELAYLDTWHEVLIQGDSNYLSIFINGVYAGKINREEIYDSTTDLLIGKHDDTNRRLLEGYIDEISILPYYRYDVSELTDGDIVYEPSLRQSAVEPPEGAITFITNKFGNFEPIITTNDASLGTWQVFGVGTQTSNTPSFALNGTDRTVSLTIADFTRLTTIDWGNEAIKGTLDISYLTALQDSIKLNDNILLSTIIWPILTQLITTFWLNGCNFSELDISSLTTIRGDLRLGNNSSLSSITLPLITASVSRFDLDNCNFTTLNLGNLQNLSGILQIHENNNLVGITLPSSSNLFTLFSAYNCNFTVLNLSNFTNLSGQILLSGNTSLSTLTMPTYSGVFTEIDLSYTNLGVISWENFTSDNSNIIIRVNDNSLTQDEVNETLVKLDTEGWTNGTLYIDGDNSGPDSVSSGFDGVAAKISLSGKSWNIYINPDRELINFTTNKTGTMTPTITTSSDTGNWYLNDEYYQDNSPSFTGLTGIELDGIMELDDYSVVTSIDLIDENLINYLDLSLLTSVNSYELNTNSELSGITFGNNNTPITKLDILSNSSIIYLDLSGLTGLGGILYFHLCSNLTGITFPNSSEDINQLYTLNSNITGTLDLSGLIGLGGGLLLYDNDNLTNVNFPITSRNINTLHIYRCDLTGTLNLTNLVNLGGNILFYQNDNLTNVNFPETSRDITTFGIYQCNLTGVLEISGLTGLGGNIKLHSNGNLTNVNFPISTNTITNFWFRECDLTGTLNLSGLTGLGGNIQLYSNSNLTDIILPNSGTTITTFSAYSCALGVLNWEVLQSGSGATGSNFVDIKLEDNNMTTTEVNGNLAKLNGTSWLSGVCYIGGNNEGIDTFSGGYNGVLAKQYLEEKGWEIYTNAEIISVFFYTNKTGSFEPSITTGTTSIATWTVEGETPQTTNDPSFTELTGNLLYVVIQISDYDYITGFTANNQKITGILDLTLLPNLTVFDFGNNFGLNLVIYPTDTQSISIFNFGSCNLKGDLDINGNTTGIINLTGFTGLGGDINFESNSLLTSLILPNSSEIITNFDISECDFTEIDLSTLTGLGGTIDMFGNSTLSGVTFPNTNETITSFDAPYCDLGVLNWEVLASGVINDNINIQIYNNNMTSAEVNETLVKLDNLEWSGGTLNIAGNNLSVDSYSGGFDGLSAKTNLESKLWIIIANESLTFITNKSGSFEPSVTKIGTSIVTWGLSGYTSQTGDTSSFTGLTGEELIGGFYIDSYPSISEIDLYDDSIINNLDLTLLSTVNSINFASNTGLTSVTNPFHNIGITSYQGHNCDLEILDLSSISNLGGDVKLYNNPNLTSVTFPSSSSAFTYLYLYNHNLTELDLSDLTGLGGDVRIYGDTNLTGITFPNSSEVFTELYLNDNDLSGTTFLNGLSALGGDIKLQNNLNLTAVIFPESSEVVTYLYAYDCNLSGTTNLSNMTRLGGDIRIYGNDNLTEINFPISSEIITKLWVHTNDLTGTLDLSNMTELGGSFTSDLNSNLTNIINPTSSQIFTLYQSNVCNLTGTLNLYGLSGLGGSFNVGGNSNLTEIINPISSQIFTYYGANACNLSGTSDLSGLTGLGGSINLFTNPDLTDINLPTSTQTFTRLWAYSCDIGVLDWDRLSGGTSDNIDIDIKDNNMTAAEVNENLYLLDQTGWLSGTCTIDGTNEGADTSSGGFNGLQAKENLEIKGWTVTVSDPNESEVLTMTWNVPSGVEVIIPQLNGYNYDYYINWGDDSTWEHITTYDGDSHIYAESGLTEIRIVGTCETLYFNNTATEKTYVSGVTHWGNTHLKIANFWGCNNLHSLPSGSTEQGKLTEVTTFYRSFTNCNSLQEIPSGIFSGNTTASIFSEIFDGCISLTSIPSGLFDDNTSATTFYLLFRNCSLTSIPDNLFDNNIDVTNMTFMFNNTDITSIPDNLFDNNVLVNSFNDTFKACTSLTSIPDNLFDNNVLVNNFSNTFNTCSSLTTIPSGLFDNNPLVTTFNRLFFNCSIINIPSGLFVNSVNAQNFDYTFTGNSLTGITSNLFDNCPLVYTFNYTFGNNGITFIPSGLFDNNTLVNIFSSTFYSTQITSIPSGLFNNTSGVTTFYRTFYSTQITSIPSGLFDYTSGVTTFDSTFWNTDITSIPSGLFDYTILVESFYRTFAYTPITSIPSTLFDNCTIVTTFYRTFYNCTTATENAPELWLREPEPIGTECFKNDTELYNYEYIPTDWGGLGYTLALSYTTNAPSTFTPSVTSISTVNWSLSGQSDETSNTANFTGLSGEELYGELASNHITGVTAIDMSNEYLLGDLNLSNLTHLTNYDFSLNSELTGLTFPTAEVEITNIDLSGCSVSVLNWEDLSGQTSHDIIINLNDNDMTTAEINETLVKLDDTTWTGGTLSISGTNEGYDDGSGGYDGTAAIINLESKGWNITIEQSFVMDTGFWNDDGFWVDTAIWLDDAYELVNEYRTVFNSMTTKPSESVVLAQDTMVRSLVNDGIWDKLDVFYVFANEFNSDGEAQINWMNPGTYNATLINAPVFTSLEGFLTGLNSKCIETNWKATYGVNYSINNASMFCYPIYDNITSSNIDMGALMGSQEGASQIQAYNGAPNLTTCYINGDGILANMIKYPNTTRLGLLTISRTTSNLQTFYINSTFKGSNAISVSKEANVTVNIGCRNTNYAGRGYFNDKRYAFGGMGAGLSSTEVSNLYSALSTYLAAT